MSGTVTDPPSLILITGVAGSGKSTVGRRLAAELGCPFVDGDDFHETASIEKIRRGIGLTDEDRENWLGRLRDRIDWTRHEHRSNVVACSALKRRYRERLCAGIESVQIVFLSISPELARERLAQRGGHFAGPSIAASQFADLEVPSGNEALHLDASLSSGELVDKILGHLKG